MSDLDGWKHCPRCASELQRAEGRAECARCGFVYYANSKPTASALIVDEQRRVLMSKRASDPAAGKWDFPGGFLEEAEHPVDALHRELQEEAGVGLIDLEFVGVFTDWYETSGRSISTLNLYWSARIGEGTPVPADDVEEFRFFRPDELPWEDLAFDHLPEVVSAWRRRDENA